jgi:hypothetical protein
MRLYDFGAGHWTNIDNFINHPSLSYHFLNIIAGFSSPGIGMRYAAVSCFLAGFGVMLYALHKTGLLTNLGLACVTLLCIFLKIDKFGAHFNNDAVAFLGGAIIFMGAVLMANDASTNQVEKGYRQSATALLFLGTLFCIATKLNTALLMAIFVFSIFIMQPRTGVKLSKALRQPLNLALILGCILVSIPYLWFMLEYGSPAPATPGQIAIISADSATAIRMALPIYLFESGRQAIINAGSDAAITYAVFFAGIAFSIVLAIIKRKSSKMPAGLAMIFIPTAIATLIVLIIHLRFSYQRHVQYGWQPELYPRYYFSLLGPYLLAFFVGLRHFKVFGILFTQQRKTET